MQPGSAKQQSLKNRLIKGAAGSFGLSMAHAGLGFLTHLLLARILGKIGFGMYAYAFSWVELLGITATFGLPQLLVREVAVYQTTSAWGLLRGILRWANQSVLMLSIGLAVIAGGVTWIFGKGGDQGMLLALWLALLALPFSSLRSLRLAAMQGLHHVVLGKIPEALFAPVIFMVLLGGTYLLSGHALQVSWVILMQVGTTAITFFIGSGMLLHILPETQRSAVAEYQRGRWVRSAIPFMLLFEMLNINSRLDILMLGAMKGPAEVGIYTVARRGVGLIILILAAVNSVLAPTIASLYAQKNMQQLQRAITKSARVVTLFAFVITVGLIVFGKWFLLLFGKDFIQGYHTLTILSIGMLVNAMMGSVGALLNMTGYERYNIVSVSCGIIFNGILNAILIPRWSVNGAAISTATSMILWNVLSFIWVYKKLGINSTAFAKIN